MPEIQLPTIDFTVITQIVIVFGWAMVLLLIDLFVSNKKIIGYLALVGLVGAAAAGIPLWNSNLSTFSNMIVLDNFGLILNWIFLGIAAISILISLDYLARQGIERGEYYTLILFATGAMMMLGQGSDLIVLFLGLELLSITLYVLAGFAYPRISSEEAAMKYLLIGAFAAGFLVFGIALLYGATGSSNLATINQVLTTQMLTPEYYTLVLVGGALVTIGFGYKIAMAPFHMWTPDVYEGAPTSVTAFMSVGTKGAGFAALTRLLLVALPSLQEVWVPALAVLAALTMIVGNLTAVVQDNVKRMLAYSSIGHAGYILMGLIAARPNQQLGVEGFLFYLVAYSLTNLAAFAILITLEQRGEAAWNFTDFAGLYGRYPWLARAMAVCMFSLAGVPPTAGFTGKFYVFTAAWQADLEWLAVIGVITSAIATFFYLRIMVQMFMRDTVRDIHPTLDRGIGFGIALATLGVLVFGIIPTPIVMLVEQSVLAASR